MASRPYDTTPERARKAGTFFARMRDPTRAIGNPLTDLLLLWGAPIVVLGIVLTWLKATELLAPAEGKQSAALLFFFATLVTYAHLVAVVPRAYINRDVFEANRFRLTVVPVALTVAMLVSPTVFIIAGIVAFFWDVHHSAMQTFGIARIYEFKAGNGPNWLRKTDLYLNWLLYVGPIFVGASFLLHADMLSRFAETPLTVLATAPGYLESGNAILRNSALALWAVGIVWAVLNYRNAMAQGYTPPPQKIALIGITGLATFVAWGFLPPLIAFATINIHHALQYYVIVWVQEGDRMTAFSRLGKRAAFAAFLVFTAIVALGYDFATRMDSHLWLVPFLACSILHFWYDGFVWSVRKKSL